MRNIVLDTESRRSVDDVKGWINKHKMGIAVLCAADLDTGEEWVFSDGYPGAKPLSELLDFLNGNVLIGHNIKTFDYRLIQEEVAKQRSEHLRVALVDTSTKRLPLGSLAQATLGTTKQMNGADAPLEWQTGDRKKVVEYCKDDVKKTRELFLYGLKNGYVFHMGENNERIPIDVNWKRSLDNAEIKEQHPECIGRHKKEKKWWQCARCASRINCIDTTPKNES